jgi:hypothetical protein
MKKIMKLNDEGEKGYLFSVDFHYLMKNMTNLIFIYYVLIIFLFKKGELNE